MNYHTKIIVDTNDNVHFIDGDGEEATHHVFKGDPAGIMHEIVAYLAGERDDLSDLTSVDLTGVIA